jgi:thiamine biosynthesis lipoprotein
MGSVATITLYAETEEQAQDGFVAAFKRIADLNATLSDYDSNSELSRICSLDKPMSSDLSTVLTHAQKLSKETQGAFDVTVGPMTHLWREARKQARLPSENELAAARRRSGFLNLVLSPDSRVACLVPAMQLDAGGIAKGYAADEALRSLAKLGMNRALVGLSGDIAASGPPPGQAGWKVRVQEELILLSHAAVSTSGDQFQFLEIEGHRYSHIIDPRSGWPLRDSQEYAVIAKTGIQADSLATALSVAGPAYIRVFEKRYGVRVITSGVRLEHSNGSHEPKQ